MTLEQQKETISTSIIRLLANLHGFKVSVPEQDHGVDMVVNKMRIYPTKRGLRYTDSDEILHLQLKCTTEKGIIRVKDGIKYDLKAKNYDDLAFRRTLSVGLPLILILIILPKKRENWIKMLGKTIVLNTEVYWFYPSKDITLSDNKESVRITISNNYKSDIDLFPKIFDLFYKKKKS